MIFVVCCQKVRQRIDRFPIDPGQISLLVFLTDKYPAVQVRLTAFHSFVPGDGLRYVIVAGNIKKRFTVRLISHEDAAWGSKHPKGYDRDAFFNISPQHLQRFRFVLKQAADGNKVRSVAAFGESLTKKAKVAANLVICVYAVAHKRLPVMLDKHIAGNPCEKLIIKVFSPRHSMT